MNNKQNTSENEHSAADNKAAAALKDVFSLHHDQAHADKIDAAIRANVRVSGTNMWVLIFAVAIASIGLNVNSTAVVIGAMLISPLMGPIVGMGYGAACLLSAALASAQTTTPKTPPAQPKPAPKTTPKTPPKTGASGTATAAKKPAAAAPSRAALMDPAKLKAVAPPVSRSLPSLSVSSPISRCPSPMT